MNKRFGLKNAKIFLTQEDCSLVPGPQKRQAIGWLFVVAFLTQPSSARAQQAQTPPVAKSSGAKSTVTKSTGAKPTNTTSTKKKKKKKKRPTVGSRMVRHARRLLEIPYTFGGRMRNGDGIDCQGVLFYAAERSQIKRRSCGWKSFTVMPTKTLRDKELGEPVAKLSPVATSELDVSLMRAGDIIFFLDPQENPAEASLTTLKGEKQWVWHTALYAGDGNMISGDPFYEKVVEVPLLPYLQEHYAASGLFILRLSSSGPQPKKCRIHKKMRIRR